MAGQSAIENITVIFTDLVGSTALSSAMPVREADDIRHRHFSTLREVISRTGCSEVKNLGDGLMVVCSTASAALACAVGMQQAVELDNRRTGLSLGLRSGMSVGEATKEDADYFGDPVIEAARLCDRAQGGQILATEMVRIFARRRTSHAFVPVGALQLTGIREPVDAFAVDWEPLPLLPEQVPLPSLLEAEPSTGLVGRDGELSSINQAYKAAAAGEGRQLVLLCGEAGMGKTTVAAQAARTAYGEGAWVLLGRCEEGLVGPYQLFTQALTHLLSHAPEELLSAHVAHAGSALERLVPTLGRRLSNLPAAKGTDADSERYLLFAAVTHVLTLACRERPVILVLDDLQWSDRASLQMLRHVVAYIKEEPLLIVGTYRDTELSHAHPFLEMLGALHRETGIVRIKLAGLDDVAIQNLIKGSAGHELDTAGIELSHAVYHETDGNPLFVGEVLRDLGEKGVLHQDHEGCWTASQSLDQLSLPESLREVIGARIARLGEPAGQILSVAAIIGREFDLELLSRASGIDEDQLLDALDAAAAAALVEELPQVPGNYRFRHAVIQHTLYGDIGPTRRARVHRRIAEALEESLGDHPETRIGELARHWSSATGPLDLAKALYYAQRAAEAAHAALAPDEAIRYYIQALDLLHQSDDKNPGRSLDLLIGLGTAQGEAGDPAYRRTLLDAAGKAQEEGDTGRLVAAAVANHRGFAAGIGNVDEDRVAVLEAALAALPHDHPDRALLLAILCSELTYGATLQRRHELAVEADTVAHQIGDDLTVVRVSNTVASPLAVPSLLDESLQRAREAAELARRIDDPLLLYGATSVLGWTAARHGDIEEEDRCLAAMDVLQTRLHQPVPTWNYLFRCGARAVLAGDPDRAEMLAHKAFDVATAGGQADAQSVFAQQFIAIQFERGRLADVIPLIESTAAENPGIPAFVAALALAFADSGRLHDARRLLGEFAAIDYALPEDIGWLTGMGCYAEAAIVCGDRDAADALLVHLAPWAGHIDHTSTLSFGPVERFLGGLYAVLGHYERAEACFAGSLAFCERVPATFFAARTQLQWAAMLMGRAGPGDHERAASFLAAVRQRATQRGYAVLEARSGEMLTALSTGSSTVENSSSKNA